MGLISRVSSRTYSSIMPGQGKGSRKIAKANRKQKNKVKNEFLEYKGEPKSLNETLTVKEKPKFDLSVLDQQDGLSSLMSRCSGFLDQVPISSSNSAASKSSVSTNSIMAESPKKIASFLDIEAAWKKATTELQNDSDSDNDVEFSMAVCPMESLPEALLPGKDMESEETKTKPPEVNMKISENN